MFLKLFKNLIFHQIKLIILNFKTLLTLNILIYNLYLIYKCCIVLKY